MQESEKKLLKDDIANKHEFIEILLNFDESSIQSRHNKNISSSLIQKNTNTGSINAAFENKDKQIIKDVPLIKYGTPVRKEVTTENVVNNEGKTKKTVCSF